jgi:hypothetical protein
MFPGEGKLIQQNAAGSVTSTDLARAKLKNSGNAWRSEAMMLCEALTRRSFRPAEVSM